MKRTELAGAVCSPFAEGGRGDLVLGGVSLRGGFSRRGRDVFPKSSCPARVNPGVLASGFSH